LPPDVTETAAAGDQQTGTAGTLLAKNTAFNLVGRGAPLPLPAQIDSRGSVCELFDPRREWHPDPLVFADFFTIRPGMAKGWNLHREHEDRYAIVRGDMDLVLYDPRPESSTCGEVCVITWSAQSGAW